MAPFINKSDGRFRLAISPCELPNTFIELDIKLTETSNAATEDGESDGDSTGRSRSSFTAGNDE
jgi:hypothetical protein